MNNREKLVALFEGAHDLYPHEEDSDFVFDSFKQELMIIPEIWVNKMLEDEEVRKIAWGMYVVAGVPWCSIMAMKGLK